MIPLQRKAIKIRHNKKIPRKKRLRRKKRK